MTTSDLTTERSIEEATRAHAKRLGVNQSRIQTYQVNLDWMLENGTLVDIHFSGAALFQSASSFAELGIKTSDTRAAHLKPGKRLLIPPHSCCHHQVVEGNKVYMGYDSEMPPPPSLFFQKPNRIVSIQYFSPDGEWLDLPCPEGDKKPRWLAIPQPEDWEAVKFSSVKARWLRLVLNKGKGVSGKDLTCNPVAAIQSVEAKCRNSVDYRRRGYGFKFVGFGGMAWIGYKAWAEWQRTWAALTAELDAIKAYLIWRHDEFTARIEEAAAAMAKEAWAAMSARHTGKFVYLANKPGGGKEAIESEEQLVEYIAARYSLPPAERIDGRLRADFMVFLPLGREQVAADKLRAGRLRNKMVEEEARQTVILQERAAQERLIREKAEAEARKIRAEAEAAEAQKEAMKRAALEKARQQMARTANPYQQMMDRLRAEFYAAAQSIAESLKKNGKLRPNVARQARDLIEWGRAMNSHDDAELDTLLRKFEGHLGTAGSVPESAALEQTLNDIAEAAAQAAARIRNEDAEIYGFDTLEL